MPENRIPIADIQYGVLIKNLDGLDPSRISSLDEIAISHNSTGSGDTDKTYKASIGNLINKINFYIDNNGVLRSGFNTGTTVKPLSDITIDNLDNNFILPIENGGTGSTERNFLKNTTDTLKGNLTIEDGNDRRASFVVKGENLPTLALTNSTVNIGFATRSSNTIALLGGDNSQASFPIIEKEIDLNHDIQGAATTFYGTATNAMSASTAQKAVQAITSDTLSSTLSVNKGGTGQSVASSVRYSFFNNNLYTSAASAKTRYIIGITEQWADGGYFSKSDLKTWLNVYDGDTSRTKNTVLAAPNGSNGKATFRSLVAADIPSLDASKITSGSFADARIPNLNASKITAGTFADARIPNLNASKITAGTLPVSRGGTGQTTQFTSYYIANGSGIGSGSTTFSVAGAKLINILARFGDSSTGGLVSLTIPNFINSSGSYYQLADDTSFIKFKLRLTSTNKVTMDNFSRTSSNCVITHINLIY